MPLILLLVTILEFSVLMFHKSSIDHGGLELHRAVRSGTANASNYRQIFCDAASLGRNRCASGDLVINVSELTRNTGSVRGNLNDGFTLVADQPFIIRTRYQHSFNITALNTITPGGVLRSHQVLFGERE